MGRVFHVTSSKLSNITDGKYLICFLSHFFYMLHLKEFRYGSTNKCRHNSYFSYIWVQFRVIVTYCYCYCSFY